jgi:putative exporter of polyketide antibiotics
MLYFFGTVFLQSAIAVQEWKLRLPRLLPMTSIAVVAVYLVFATLLAMVGKVESIDRATPVIWEWLAFVALMVWLASHTTLLGSRRPNVTHVESHVRAGA